MKPTFITTAILLLTSLVWIETTPAQKIAWNFTPGDNFDVKFDQDTVVTTTFNLIERKIGTRVQLSMEWRVLSVSPVNVAVIQQTITDISITMTTPTKTIQVDSTKTNKSDAKVERNMWTQIQPLIGATFDVQMYPNGNIGDVTTPEATMALLRNANGSMRLRELLTPEGLRELFSQSVIYLPEEDLSEPWQVEKNSSTEMGDFQSTQTFTLEGEAEVDGKTMQRISSSMTTTQSPVEDKRANILTKSNGAGELFFDAEGRLFHLFQLHQ